MSLRLRTFSGVLVLALTGCGGNDFSATQAYDASVDALVDAPTVDAVVDAPTVDAAVDAPTSDSAQDAAIESATDAEEDVQVDSSTPVDSGADSGVDSADDSTVSSDATPCTVETAVFQAIEDTAISGPSSNTCADPGMICYGNGTFVHLVESGALRQRGLVKFQVPAPLKKAVSAELKLPVQEQCAGVQLGAGELQLRPMRTDWAEGKCEAGKNVDGATWIVATPTVGCWFSPGANSEGAGQDMGVIVGKIAVTETSKSAKFLMGPVELAVLATWKNTQNMLAFRVTANSGHYCYGTKEALLAPTLTVTYCKE